MGLAAYRKKRSFGKTPEPAGKARGSGKRLRFVVQKHQASRLHYDFRLELGGVLLSWAVPKGPSLDPADKRLAMHVEDHPLEYRRFEGTIPEGNYGAGTVMVWDEGTYGPYEKTDDAEKYLRAGYKKGDLKFVLRGRKLSGAYALVKMKGWGSRRQGGRSESQNWLLIKKQDDGAAKKDVTKQDRSAKTGRTLEEIAAGKGGRRQWKSDRSADERTATRAATGRKRKVTDVKLMLAKLAEEPFDRPGWLFETKWDGYRAIAEADGKRIKLYSRNATSFIADYPPVVDALKRLDHPAVLDGEIVVLDGKGRSSFQGLQDYRKTGKGNLVYKAFDLLSLDGHDIREFPLRDRKELLCKLVKEVDGIEYSRHVEEAGMAFYADAVKHGLEGIMAKDANSPYRCGPRSGEWVKVKTVARQEAVIGGFTEPRGSRKALGAVLLGVYEDNGDFVYIGHTGGGFTGSDLLELRKRLDKRVRKTSPFRSEPKPNAPVTWVKPELVCEVKFREWTDGGHMRQPVMIGMREDKPAKDVRREVEHQAPGEDSDSADPRSDATAKEPIPEQASPDGPDERTVRVGGHRLKQTHLRKTYWPKDGYTKGDLIGYYGRMAKTILPYLKDRPESLHRHPNGIEGSSFYQKDVADQPPGWVRTKSIHSESNDKDINYLVCDDQATLLYLANLGCIELNPWLSRTKALDKPDFLLIDLDAKTSKFPVVVEIAQEIRKLLEQIGAASYPKTSGKSGMHICLPLGAKYGYEQSRQFAEILMQFAHRRCPDLTSLERSPDKRKGRVYLDFLQNRRGQTMAAPYCVRPVPGAAVSTPLRWDEVDESLDPRNFTIENIGDRIKEVGDLWKPVLGKGVDLKKALAKLEKLA